MLHVLRGRGRLEGEFDTLKINNLSDWPHACFSDHILFLTIGYKVYNFNSPSH